MEPPADIETDLPCAICGYNLKGLSPDSNCPECGQSIERTLDASSSLKRCDPQWLRRQSLTMLILSAVALLDSNLRNAWYPLYTGYIWSGFILIMTVIGVFRLSAAESDVAFAARPFDSFRRGIRAAAVVLLVFNVIYFLPRFLDYRLMNFLGFVAIVAMVAINWLVPLFLRRLAKCAGDAALVTHARLILWALPIQCLLQIGSQTLLRIIDSFGRTDNVSVSLIGFVNCVASVTACGYLLLLGRLHQVLSTIARERKYAQQLTPTS